MNFRKNIPLVAIALVLAGVIIYLFGKKEESVVYVDTIRLFNEFKYTKELEKSYEKTLISSKNRYDSIAAQAQLHPGDLVLNDQLKEEENRFSVVYEQIKGTITQKVWERLDPLVKEFGTGHKYEIIVGANGTGTVLYGKEQKDKTQEVIDFVNKKL